mmetsp:Transcript_40372/g.88637  ORF Transcript_40372/g.88637 Transcript_40372/m.88637 type:complete len:264 (+) Transcript_40372:175-966(+)
MELCGFLKLASLVVGHRLHKLFLRVHHERSSRSDCLRDRLSREEDDARVVLVGAKSHAPAFAEHDEPRLAHRLLSIAHEDVASAHEEHHVVARRQVKLVHSVLLIELDLPQVHGRECARGAREACVRASDDAHSAARKRRVWDLLLLDRLVSWRGHLVLRRQVDPQLHHLHDAALAQKIARNELLVHEATCRGHPLHVARPNDVAMSERVGVLDLALEGDCYRLEPAVWVLADAAPASRRLEVLGGGVVKHQEGADCGSKGKG